MRNSICGERVITKGRKDTGESELLWLFIGERVNVRVIVGGQKS